MSDKLSNLQRAGRLLQLLGWLAAIVFVLIFTMEDPEDPFLTDAKITRPRGSVDEPRLSALIAAAKPPRLG